MSCRESRGNQVMVEEQEIIEVLMMNTDFFLYLPFYYAEKQDFFGYLPKKYKVKILDHQDSIRKECNNDRITCQKLIDNCKLSQDNPNKKNKLFFAIADPTKFITQESTTEKLNIEENPDFKDLMILSTLVTNTAFWAISQKNAQSEIKHLEDLKKFKQIISYPEGTTSYGLACRILQLKNQEIRSTELRNLNQINNINDNYNLIIISPEQESLFFSYLEDDERGKNSFALYPDIVKLTQGYEDKFVPYMLGKCTHFNNLIVTALIAHNSIKGLGKDNYEPLIKGVLRGIQRAMLEIYSFEEYIKIDNNNSKKMIFDIQKISQSQLHKSFLKKIKSSLSGKLSNIHEDVIEQALIKAINGRIIPRLIEITDADWENAVIVSLMAQQTRSKDEHSTMIDWEKHFNWEKYSDLAQSSYKNSIEDYQKYAKQAIEQEIYQPIFKEIPQLKQEKETLIEDKQRLEGDKETFIEDKQQLERDKKTLTKNKQKNRVIFFGIGLLIPSILIGLIGSFTSRSKDYWVISC